MTAGQSDWLQARVAATPEAPAVVFGDQTLSYSTLDARARRLANNLNALGVRPGEVVAALLENGLEWPVLLWALRIQGGVLLPLNARLTAHELVHPLRDARVRVLLHADGRLGETARMAAAGADPVVTGALDALGDLRLEAPLSSPFDGPDSERLRGAMALLYTSGTTGSPKGVVLGPEAFRSSAESAQALLGADETDRWLVCMPLFHVGGLSILIRSGLAGGAAVIHPSFDAEHVSRALEERAITQLSLVANMLDRILAVRGRRPAPSSLRCVLLGGGPTPPDLIDRALELGWPIAPTYGLTETASQVATRPPGVPGRRPETSLWALPGTQLRVVDDRGRDQPVGQAGEIWVSGPTLMRGYLSLPQVNQKVLCEGWLHTGDMGQLDGEGRLTVLDRREDLIVSGGENIYPAEIEAALLRHPEVAEAGVVGVPDPQFGARPVAYWVAVEPDRHAPDLNAHCRSLLAGFKIPVAFYRCSVLPRSPSGKLLRRDLSPLSKAE